MIASFIATFSIVESRMEEVVIDKWDPITPSILYPQNVTGWAFNVLTSDGSFLELNITASGNLTVTIGKVAYYDEITKRKLWSNVIFNQTETSFYQKISIIGEDVEFLEIKNCGTKPVEVSGSIIKLDYVKYSYYPYFSLGCLTFLTGLITLIYGVFTTSKRKRKKRLYRGRMRMPRSYSFTDTRTEKVRS
ncbi:MAG: hypothetical protein QXF61_07585 [Nitrososphaeria archaeon]